MMQPLKVTFILFLSKSNPRGLVPIYCRLTLNKRVKQFATGHFIAPQRWSKVALRVVGSSDKDKTINKHLSALETTFARIEKQLYDEGVTVDLEVIYNRFIGKQTERTLRQIYDDRMAVMERLIGAEYTEATVQKFREVYGHLKNYLLSAGRDDIPLKQVGYPLIKQFEEYLLGRNLKAPTVNKIIQRFRQMILYANRCGYIQHNPFLDYKPLKERKLLVYLTPEELEALETYVFTSKRLEQVRNIYLFSVFTGLAYNEAIELRADQIIMGFDGRRWIEMVRKKTGRRLSIPLLQKAIDLIERLDAKREGYILPRISNQKINDYLKEIAQEVGIDKHLTHHTARKTFATTILLYNDIPIEIVSKLLGHNDIKVTQQAYAEVMNRSISKHIGLLEEKLG